MSGRSSNSGRPSVALPRGSGGLTVSGVGRLSVGADGSLKRSGIRSIVEMRPSAPLSRESLAPAYEVELGAGMEGMRWTHASALIIADMLGTGVLGVPGALKDLGWVAGLIVLVAYYPLNLYTGMLLERLRRLVPTAVALADIAQATLGRVPSFMAWIGVFVYLQFLLGNYVVVLATSLQAAFASDSGWEMSTGAAWLVSALALLFTNQIRTLQNCTALCIVSGISMVAAILLCTYSVLSAHSCPDTATGGLRVAGSGFSLWIAMDACSTFADAFAGQCLFLEMMSEMREPKEFTRALNVAMPVCLVIYVAVGSVILAECGEHTPDYVLDAIPKGSTISRVVGALLFLHTIVSYTLNQQVLCRGVHLLLFPAHAAVSARGAPGFCAATAEWFGITTFHLMIAVALAAGCGGSFSAIVHLIGSLLATPLGLTLPILCFLGIARGLNELPKRLSEAAAAAMLLALSIGLTILGTIAAVIGLSG